jgi:hypothetical protein
MNAYILLDRTGSMGPIWTEALGSVNAYVEQLAKDEDPNDKTRITIACFDHQETLQFDILRRDVTAESFRPLTDADASPRGMTPLFDAIARIAALAEKDAPEKAVLIVMTDGEENSSQEVTKQGAAAALDRIRKKGWQVVFLGANFDAFGEASKVGVAMSQTINAAPAAMSASMMTLAKKSRAYERMNENVGFSDADRAEAGFNKPA